METTKTMTMTTAATDDAPNDGAPTAAAAAGADANNADAENASARASPLPAHLRDFLPATLSRLAAGLPLHELDVIIKEATACEDAL